MSKKSEKKNNEFQYVSYDPSRASAPEFCIHMESEDIIRDYEESKLDMLKDIMKIIKKCDKLSQEEIKKKLVKFVKNYNSWCPSIDDIPTAVLVERDEDDEYDGDDIEND